MTASRIRRRLFVALFSAFCLGSQWVTSLAAQTTVNTATKPPISSDKPQSSADVDLFAEPAEKAEIKQDKPSFYVRAEVNRASRRYREGESIELTVASEADAYLYVLYRQADGQAFQIFPNVGTASNKLTARQAVKIPAPGDRFEWTVGAPFGKETIQVIASKEPLTKLEDPTLRKDVFNAVGPERLKALAVELRGESPAAWGTDQVEVVTYAKSEVPDAPRGRRFGIFFGVSTYQFNTEAEQASPTGRGMNLPCCHRDARRMADLMKEQCGLDEVRIYTNEKATRKNLEEAMTKWLPSVSQPGDTVFIYFSGHGAQIPDDDGDERDGKDEYLLPHDFMSAGVLVKLLEKAKNNQLDPALAPVVKQLVELIQRVGLEKGALALAQVTGVSDDLFGHWAQKLAGRQVVVLLDICYSGGFSAQEKDIADAKTANFDFVDGEFARLKDLGQRDMALLAASGSQETASVREEADLSVMTFHLADLLEKSDQPVTIESAYRFCLPQMKHYFVRTNEALLAAKKRPLTPHVPILLNLCTKPVVLKP